MGKGESGKPVNLGPEINTPGNELFPHVRENQTLYFSSDGLPGLGGLDVFMAVPDSSGKWSVTHPGYPLNSPADDFGITFYPEGERGFFSSNRDDIRGYDHIYSFYLPPLDIRLEGYILDHEGSAVRNATLEIISKKGDILHIVAGENGFYTVDIQHGTGYMMLARAKGYLNQHFSFSTAPEEKDEIYILDFFLYPAQQSVLIKKLYYDVDHFLINQTAKEDIEDVIRLLSSNPHLRIEINGHTDHTGTVEYNRELSEKRARVTASYLENRGIDKNRLYVKGHGKELPYIITPSDHEKWEFLKEGAILNGTFIEQLEPVQQTIANQLNRRVEIRIRTEDHLF